MLQLIEHHVILASGLCYIVAGIAFLIDGKIVPALAFFGWGLGNISISWYNF